MNDYDDVAVQEWTYAHPGRDFTPFDYLATMNKTLVCSPGECGFYSSIGYQLLGLLLAWESGAEHWTTFDQLSVLPPSLQTELTALGIEFPLLGPCSDHPKICHQYAAWHVDDQPHQLHFFDIDDASCLNAWTCGNIAASPAAVATYFYELFHGKVVSRATLAEMQKWHPFTVGPILHLIACEGWLFFGEHSNCIGLSFEISAWILLTPARLGWMARWGTAWGHSTASGSSLKTTFRR
jgi:CubicO group peptidase (beta-lactamase class C family)